MRKSYIKLSRLSVAAMLVLVVAVTLTACGLLLSKPITQIGDPLSTSSASLALSEQGETAEVIVPSATQPSESCSDGENTVLGSPEDNIPSESNTSIEESISSSGISPMDTEPTDDPPEDTSDGEMTEEPSSDDHATENTSTDTEATAACPHTPTVIPSVAPSCLTAGKTEGSVCGICGEILSSQEEIPPARHVYDVGLGYKCTVCGNQAKCPTPLLNAEGDVTLTWGETFTLSWQYLESPLFPTVCMVTAIGEDGQSTDLWNAWKSDASYSRLCRQDGEAFTLRVYVCYEAGGEPILATKSESAAVTVTVSARETLEAPGFVTGNQVTTTAGRDVTVAWGSVAETGSHVVYDVVLLLPDGETQPLQTACTETVCTVPASVLTAEGTYTLQVIARDENETYRDSVPASLRILVVPPPEVGEQDFSNPARYAADYFYNYLATLENGAGLQGYYRLIDATLTEFHSSNQTAETVRVADGKEYAYAAKLDFTSFGLTLEEASSVRSLYMYDHPLYYWLSNTFVYTNTTLYFCVETNYATGKARAQGNELVYRGVADMSETVIDMESPYRIALAYYEKLLALADYAYEEDGTTPQDDPWAHSVIGVFDPNRNQVVCEGFAKAYSLLLNYHGVENISVIGESRGVGHMWNLLRLDDGEWYWCDITWDDKTYSPLGTDYKYFCVTDTQDVLYYYVRDGIESGFSYTFGDPSTFMDDHTVRWDLGITLDMSGVLPARAETPFDGRGLELRDAFTVDGMTYAKTGFGKVQLVDVGSRRSVTVPESVTYEGITYTVTSIGLINGEGVYMTGRLLPLFAASMYIPKTVTYIWDNALSGLLVTITVDPENPNYTTQNGVLRPKN